MKIEIINIVILMFTSVLFSQNQTTKISIEDSAFNDYFLNKENIPVVQGKIINITEKEIEEVKINYTIVTPFKEPQIKKNTILKKDGTFELELSYAFPYQEIGISVGDLYYAEIYANSDLLIELDFNILKSSKTIINNRELNGVYFNGSGIKYIGNDGELNNFMNNHILFGITHQLEVMLELHNLRDNKDLKSSHFIEKYDHIYSKLKKLDDEYIDNKGSKYSWVIENERLSKYYSGLLRMNQMYWQGESINENLLGKIKNHKPFLISHNSANFYKWLFYYIQSESTTSYFKKLSSDRSNSRQNLIDSIGSMISYYTNRTKDTILASYTYKNALSRIYDERSVTLKTSQLANLLDSIFETPKADFLKLKISSPDHQEQNLINEEILKGVKTEWCKTVIREEFKKTTQKLNTINKILIESQPFNSIMNIGKPIAKFPFGARLYDVDSLSYKELLTNLKTTFKGKALLIDFWATWCGPCIQDMPYSNKLHHEAKGLPIEFIYLCTSSGSSIDKWKSKIAELKQPGTHLFVNKSIVNELMDLFSLSGFPSYVFINSKGEYKPRVIGRISTIDKNKLINLIE